MYGDDAAQYDGLNDAECAASDTGRRKLGVTAWVIGFSAKFCRKEKNAFRKIDRAVQAEH